MRATEVFIPGSFPTETYIQRSDENYEVVLNDALSMDGMVLSISGPSKSGKTVLIEKVVGKDYLISISGAGIKNSTDLWEAVLDWMEAPYEVQETAKHSDKIGTELGVSGGASVFGFAKAEASAKAKLDSESVNEESSTRRRTGASQVVRELANSDFVILVDDFHYIPRDIQGEVARQIKDVVRQKVRICAATVSHRGDDVMRANPELRGRLQTIDLPYWGIADLKRIATTGLSKLNATINAQSLERLAKEAAGSPQLMQLICLQMCFVKDLRSKSEDSIAIDISERDFSAIFEQTSTSTDFRSLFDVLDCGPKLRGKERKIYSFKDESSGDVYRCILKAIAADPPTLSFNYDSLVARTRSICTDEFPSGSSLFGSCGQMIKLAQEHFPNERAIDLDTEKEVLDIPDPYLSFYLRWSGRLLEKTG
jgi:hypothetical protein